MKEPGGDRSSGLGEVSPLDRDLRSGETGSGELFDAAIDDGAEVPPSLHPPVANSSFEPPDDRSPLGLTLIAVALCLLAIAALVWLTPLRRFVPLFSSPADEAQLAEVGDSPEVPEFRGEELVPTAELADTETPVANGDLDSRLRGLIGTVSSHPALAKWLVTDRLLDRFVAVVANMAYGQDPSVHVPFLRASEPIRVEDDAGQLRMNRATFQRFDDVVAVFESLDEQGSTELYRTFQSELEASYAELGYGEPFSAALVRAVRQVEAIPVLDGPPEVERWISGYRYVDPKLEALDPAQKLLLRAGPNHLQRVQAKLRRLAGALALEGVQVADY